MKKLAVITAAYALFALIFSMTVFAGVSFGDENASKGYITVEYDGSLDKKIIVTVTATGSKETKYYYTIGNEPVNIPLNLGDEALYTISVAQNTVGKKYKVIAKKQFKVEVTSPEGRFLVANPKVNYSSSMSCMKEYSKLLAKVNDKKAVVDAVYADMLKKIKYDKAKADNPPVNYEPNLEMIFKGKKGICYDYASMFAAVLRSNGIPTKVCFGYAPEIRSLHAWNEVYLNGEWITVDVTYDAAYFNAGASVSMKKDSSLFKVTDTY